jgi:hypothetical protein
MAHFAKLGSNNKVIQVLTLDNKDMLNADGVEDESVGQQYLEKHNNWSAQMWIQTSYNTIANKHLSGDNSKAFRGNYAGIGFEWDEENQIFWSKQPYPSWTKNISTASWEAPITKPSLTEEQTSQNEAETHTWVYTWNEDNQSWDINNYR